MSTLVLGANGMLGHKMFQRLLLQFPDTWCTVRGSAEEAAALAPGLLDRNVIAQVDAMDWPALAFLLGNRRPQFIVNCVGVIKQRAEAREAIPSITINSLLPHRLASWCERWNACLIHFSTDCVFSGERGNYSEQDPSDAQDLYGKTKFLGESEPRKRVDPPYVDYRPRTGAVRVAAGVVPQSRSRAGAGLHPRLVLGSHHELSGGFGGQDY